MAFFRKSLFRKFFLFLLILTGIAIGAGVLIPKLDLPPQRVFQTYSALLVLFALLAFFMYFSSVARPLKKILREVKAMLTGKQYNRIYTDRIDEWAMFAHFFNDVSRNLENIAGTVEEGQRMSSELELASDIQKRILPKSIPQIQGIDVFGNTRQAVEVGGDSYDIIQTENSVFLYVGDVTGHGVPAGLVMAMVNSLVHSFCERYASGYDVFVQTNRLLKPRIKPSMFMTAAMLRYEKQTQKMFLTGAGHEHIIHFHKATGNCEARKTGGIALGMLPDNSKIIKEEALAFESGDILALYSDGIVEARNTAGELFGLARLKEMFEKYALSTKTSQEIFTAVSAEFAQFVENQPQQDDITLIVIRKA